MMSYCVVVVVTFISRFFFFFLIIRLPRRSTLFPYTTLFRSLRAAVLSTARGRKRPSEREADSGIAFRRTRSEEHTSELQSRPHLVCRLLLEKKKIKKKSTMTEKQAHDPLQAHYYRKKIRTVQ